MVVGKNIYVADARYTDTNENNKIGNVSYEIVKWEVNPPIIFCCKHSNWNYIL